MKEDKNEQDNEKELKPPKKKISSYLPVGLLKDLDVSEDSSCEEIEETVTSVGQRRSSNKNSQQNFKRRRSSSHDFLNSIRIINLFSLDKNQIPIANLNNKPSTFFQQNNITMNSNNNMMIKPSSLKRNNISNPHKTVSYNLSNNTTNYTHPVSYEPKMIQPRQKLSERTLNKKNMVNFINPNTNIGINLGYAPVITKKHSSKSIQREFIDPDMLNLNQTFKEFLDISGNKLSTIIRTSIGSRFLQKMLDKIQEDDIDTIFYQLSDEIIDLMCDNYGNYFMQKIITKCNLNQRIFLYEKLRAEHKFIFIANDIAGTHCLQALIGNMKSEKEEKIIRDNLINHLLELSCNINSTHVVQKIVEELKEPKRDYINQFVIMNFLPLCKDVNGICLIKKFISENKEEAITKSILLCLEKDYVEITQDQFGNYAVQHALDQFGYSKCYNIIRLICKNIVYFANQKFSSNVVDKIVISLHHNNFNEFSLLIQAMFMNNENMFEMLRNKFGMFVLMNSIKLINMEQKFIIRNFLIKKLNVVDNIEDQTLLTRLVKNIQ